MVFETKGKSTICAILNAQDLKKYDVTFDEMSYSSIKTRHLIWSVLSAARDEIEFSADLDGQIQIEVYPIEPDGCKMVFTDLLQGKAKTAGKKMKVKPLIFEFENADNLLDAAQFFRTQSLSQVTADLFQKGGKYRLVIHSPVRFFPLTPHCLQFAKVVQGTLKLAQTSEYWNKIVSSTAISALSQ